LRGVKIKHIFILLISLAFCTGLHGTGISINPAPPVNPAILITKNVLHFLIMLLAALSVVLTVILFLTSKLKKVNRELTKRNQEIEDINQKLIGANTELAVQKEIVTKEFLETDKFFKMLIQSADDGISFYDKDWNLKFSNAAFFSLIGQTKESYSFVDPSSSIHPDDIDYMSERLKALKMIAQIGKGPSSAYILK